MAPLTLSARRNAVSRDDCLQTPRNKRHAALVHRDRQPKESSMNMRRSIGVIAVAAAMLPFSAALADGGGSSDPPTLDPQYQEAVSLIKAEQFALAIKVLESYVARVRNDASAENWLGYSYRKTGQLEPAFVHYHKALKLDPRHRGAHEYIGEAYLMAGNLAKAEEHLKILGRLCWVPCEELDDLQKAVAEYKTKKGSVTSGK
jgi:Flp pilus assembly protein TadD